MVLRSIQLVHDRSCASHSSNVTIRRRGRRLVPIVLAVLLLAASAPEVSVAQSQAAAGARQLSQQQTVRPDLPPLSPDEAAFLDATAMHRGRLARLFTSLQEFQRVADA